MSIFLGKQFFYRLGGVCLGIFAYNLFFSDYFDLIQTLGICSLFGIAFTFGHFTDKR